MARHQSGEEGSTYVSDESLFKHHLLPGGYAFSLARSTCLQRRKSLQTSQPIRRVKKKNPGKVRVRASRVPFSSQFATMVILPIQVNASFPKMS